MVSLHSKERFANHRTNSVSLSRAIAVAAITKIMMVSHVEQTICVFPLLLPKVRGPGKKEVTSTVIKC